MRQQASSAQHPLDPVADQRHHHVAAADAARRQGAREPGRHRDQLAEVPDAALAVARRSPAAPASTPGSARAGPRSGSRRSQSADADPRLRPARIGCVADRARGGASEPIIGDRGAGRLRRARLLRPRPRARERRGLGVAMRVVHEDERSILLLDREPIRWRGAEASGLAWIEGDRWRDGPASWEEASIRGACGLAIEGRRRFVHSSVSGLARLYWLEERRRDVLRLADRPAGRAPRRGRSQSTGTRGRRR